MDLEIPEAPDAIGAVVEEILQEEESRYLLFGAMSVLTMHTQRAISSGDRELLRRCFIFVDRAEAAGDDSVRNYIGVCYFKSMNFRDQKTQRSWALEELPPRSAAVARIFHPDLFDK